MVFVSERIQSASFHDLFDCILIFTNKIEYCQLLNVEKDFLLLFFGNCEEVCFYLNKRQRRVVILCDLQEGKRSRITDQSRRPPKHDKRPTVRVGPGWENASNHGNSACAALRRLESAFRRGLVRSASDSCLGALELRVRKRSLACLYLAVRQNLSH